MKSGRPTLFKVVNWNRSWYVFGWDIKEKRYRIMTEHRTEKEANVELERRYESRRLNIKFIEQINGFNYRVKDTANDTTNEATIEVEQGR